MSCEEIRGKGGVQVFICSRGQRQKHCSVTGCREWSRKQCDFPLSGRHAGKTCDRELCDAHAVRQQEIERVEGGMRVLDSVDYCPPHASMGPR